MESISGPTFKAILTQAGVNQAEFARLADVTARQVNNWCQGRAAVPRWAALLAIACRELSAEALAITLDELPRTSGENVA
jgi:transcriptional regulator with XRE-family HTH domain